MYKSTQKEQSGIPKFTHYFNSLECPHRTNKGNYYYPLNEIFFLTISAVISGSDGWTTVQEFGESVGDTVRCRNEWLLLITI